MWRKTVSTYRSVCTKQDLNRPCHGVSLRWGLTLKAYTYDWPLSRIAKDTPPALSAETSRCTWLSTSATNDPDPFCREMILTS
ncbi:hypothetical protein FHY16_000700 [Xanthomonas campestris]|nr:hypothetical protein [Xanthomonas euroxanthea]